jgi:hypothetical protein
MPLPIDDDTTIVRPDGLSVRRRRHELAFSPRDLVEAIALAQERATGLRDTITPVQLSGIEERGESVSWAMLRLVASGLDCDPVDILAPDGEEDEDRMEEEEPKGDDAVSTRNL